MGGEKRAPWRSLTSLRRGLDAMFSQNIGDGALGPVANTDTKLLIYGLFQKGRVLAQDGISIHSRRSEAIECKKPSVWR